MTITIIGHGYVGLVTAAVFADLGNTVWVIGRTKEKISRLQKGDPLIYEPGLEELLKRNLKAGRLKFTLNYKEAIPSSSIIFICVGTPSKQDGEADLSHVAAPHLACRVGEDDVFCLEDALRVLPVPVREGPALRSRRRARNRRGQPYRRGTSHNHAAPVDRA